MSAEPGIAIEELLEQLNGWPRGTRVTFSGVMQFQRVKRRGQNLIDIELSPQVYVDRENDQFVLTNDASPFELGLIH